MSYYAQADPNIHYLESYLYLIKFSKLFNYLFYKLK